MKFLAEMGLARSPVAFLRDQGLQRLEDDKSIEEGRVDQAAVKLWYITEVAGDTVVVEGVRVGNEGHPSNTDKGIEA